VVISDGEIIEQYLARHSGARRAAVGPGYPADRGARWLPAVLIEEGCLPDALYIVTRGGVEVHLHARDGQDFVVARHGPGYYVGEVELLRGGNSIATVRASAEHGAEVAVLEPDEFFELMGESEATRALVERVAQQRVTENVTSRNT
jgi:CRP-like cAMP-binding protein